jgi:signal transduction histidine kinase
MGLSRVFKQESLGDKRIAIRIEKVQRNFIWLGIGFALILLQPPILAQVPKKTIYIFTLAIAVMTFSWFQLLPKKFSGPLKNLIYTIVAVFIISFLVHWTGGVESFAVFLYALVALTVAISMSFYAFVFFLLLIAANIFFQAFLTFGTANFITDLSLSIFWVWGVSMTACYGRLLSSQLTFISHQLQLPIFALSDYLQKMSRLTTTTKIRQISEQLWQASLKLSRLVDLFLNIAKIESGRLTFNIQETDLTQCLRMVIENFEPVAKTRNIKILCEGPDKIIADCDQDRVCEVLTNLVDNAIKLSREGAKITLTVKRSDGQVVTSVIDCAGGISPEAQKHIFEKYYRAKEGGKVPGTGLGLYISKKLIEKQNGKIWFETRPGEGTTFSFSLPLVKK